MKPILFSTPMVQAILEGRKTMTRRIVKKKFDNTDIQWKELHSGKTRILVEMQNDAPPPVKTETGHIYSLKGYAEIKWPYQVGDILWVRETWQRVLQGSDSGLKYAYVFKADDDCYKDTIEEWQGWKPSIFMPKEACRLFLKIKSIRVERLQDITEEDAIAEGVEENVCLIPSDCPSRLCTEGCANKGEYYRYAKPMDFDAEPCYNAVESFQTLWQSINHNWNDNPWVWVIEFERSENPEE